jgi:DNA-damage-inducible protein D
LTNYQQFNLKTMKRTEILDLLKKFESISYETEGVECWSARELQKLLGYSKWENFEKVLEKAKIACEHAGSDSKDHFPDVRKMIGAGKGAEIQVVDVALTRYACYLIAQNGDARKPEVAFAQTYFAVQTRKAEVIEKRILEKERVNAREKLSKTESQLSQILYEKGVDDKGFAIIRSKGDQALFLLSTQKLKERMNIPKNRPIADFLPTVSIKAKDLAAEMTSFNVQNNDLAGQGTIEVEHVDNNTAVRKMLLKRGIKPEELPVAEDVKIIQRKLEKEDNKAINKK